MKGKGIRELIPPGEGEGLVGLSHETDGDAHFVPKSRLMRFNQFNSYYFIPDKILCALVTFLERGHFVMVIIKSMHLINLHF